MASANKTVVLFDKMSNIASNNLPRMWLTFQPPMSLRDKMHFYTLRVKTQSETSKER